MQTPATTISSTDGINTLGERLRTVSVVMGLQPLNVNDGPWPGYTYVISKGDTSQALTFDKNKVILSEYKGKPNQRWVCHSKGGWLGFTNDPGETTLFMGHLDKKKLVCRVNHHLKNEMFCVRKRPEEGFQILNRVEDDLWPLGIDKDGDLAIVRGSGAWWGFTKIT